MCLDRARLASLTIGGSPSEGNLKGEAYHLSICRKLKFEPHIKPKFSSKVSRNSEFPRANQRERLKKNCILDYLCFVFFFGKIPRFVFRKGFETKIQPYLNF